MSLEERLKLARKHAGLTQPQLSNLVDVSKRAIVSYEKDASKIQIGLLYQIAKICHINDVWLLTGKGNMLDSDLQENQNQLSEPSIKYGYCESKPEIQNLENNDGIVNYQDIIEAEHAKLIQGFKNKERAKRLNEKLIKLEKLSEVQLDKLEQEIDKRIEIVEDVIIEQEKKEINGAWNGQERRENKAS